MRLIRLTSAILGATLLLSACGGDTQDAADGTVETQPSSLTIYSGRSQELVGPIIDRFEETTGIRARVRYGDTAEMAAAILEEGPRSPADIFFAQDAGALGALAAEGRLAELPAGILEQVPQAFRSPQGSWVGVSGRARVVVYNTERVDSGELPESILGFTDPRWRGRIGWSPTNGSFQSFVTALRLLEGEEAARSWLEEMVANEPHVFPGNTPIVQAVIAGEIDAGFVNHYYLMNIAKEDPTALDRAANYFPPGGDPGSLVNIAGVGVLGNADAPEAALRFVRFLLEEEAQRYFRQETSEYPLARGIDALPELPSLEEIGPPDIDLSNLDDLQGTVKLLTETGAL